MSLWRTSGTHTGRVIPHRDCSPLLRTPPYQFPSKGCHRFPPCPKLSPHSLSAPSSRLSAGRRQTSTAVCGRFVIGVNRRGRMKLCVPLSQKLPFVLCGDQRGDLGWAPAGRSGLMYHDKAIRHCRRENVQSRHPLGTHFTRFLCVVAAAFYDSFMWLENWTTDVNYNP